jgi:3-deoxy-manno-octulosonate cytidylyltransferase (CMP-KDO synthetase)
MPRELPTESARAVAIVPARLASTRLPRKMLLAETGCCLFEHTARVVLSSGAFARVVVATDSPEVVLAAEKAGLEAVITRNDHKSGTDRVSEAWQKLAAAGERARVVVNVQGDEPEIDPRDLERVVEVFVDPKVGIATLAALFSSDEEWRRPDVVKVVCDERGVALYFSRAPIPGRGHGAPAIAARDLPVRRHIGVYAFRPEALARCAALPAGRLEQVESLEQLRWLEAGERIRVASASRAPQGIDTREDYDGFVSRWRAAQRDGQFVPAARFLRAPRSLEAWKADRLSSPGR